MFLEAGTSGPDALRPSAPAKGHFQLQGLSALLHCNRLKRACCPCHRQTRHVLQCSKSRRGMSCDEAWLVIGIDSTGCGKGKRLTSRHLIQSQMRCVSSALIHTGTLVIKREHEAITSANKATYQQNGPTVPLTSTPLTPVPRFFPA